MRVAAWPSSVMVPTVRCASDTARSATSVDFDAWAAISPIDAASSSTELAATATLSDAAVTRRSAVCASDETVSADLLRSLELVSSFCDAVRNRPSAAPTELLNCAIVRAIVSARAICAVLASLCVRASFSRSTMLSRNTITVRAMSPISSRAWVAGMRAVVSPAARRFMAPTRPCSGWVMLRPIRKLKPRPSATMAMPTIMMPLRVLFCEADRASVARRAALFAAMTMASVGGSMFWLSMSISARSGKVRLVASIQRTKIAA